MKIIFPCPLSNIFWAISRVKIKGASKFGARGLSSGLADQAIKLGIKVTDVNPGPTDSDYWGDRKVPREKFLKPEDVARVICFVLNQPDDVLIREINFDSLQFLKG